MWQGLDAFATNEFAAALEAGAATIEDLRSFVLVHKVVFMTESIAGKNEKARQRMFAQRAAIWMASDRGGRERLMLEYVKRAVQLLYEREIRRRQALGTPQAGGRGGEGESEEERRRKDEKVRRRVRDMEQRGGMKQIVSLLTGQVVVAPDTGDVSEGAGDVLRRGARAARRWAGAERRREWGRVRVPCQAGDASADAGGVHEGQLGSRRRPPRGRAGPPQAVPANGDR
jgi:hypothetical protein